MRRRRCLTLRPQPPAAVPRYVERTQHDDRAPAWLHHPTITGMNSGGFVALYASVERYILDHPPISLHHLPARQRILRRPPCQSWVRVRHRSRTCMSGLRRLEVRLMTKT